ncbi:MAG: 4Fe-4S binding protein [Gracilibacteraceae bacterium]|nr:4Fe-4S binding protein [Gracilibacteraceae bacterium]
MKKVLPFVAVIALIAALVYAQTVHKMDQETVLGYYRELLPEAVSFEPLSDRVAAAWDSSGSVAAYVGVSSYVGYGGPLLVGAVVRPDGLLEKPVILESKETPSYLTKIEREGFYRQFAVLRADAALTPGFDVDTVSGATLSTRAIVLSVADVAHTAAIQGLGLTPQKADMPWQIGAAEFAAAALFALSLLASKIKALAKQRLVLLGLSIVVLGFWLNRSLSLAQFQAALLGFFPNIAQNLLWYIVLLGVLFPAAALGKNLYCQYACPFCGLQELAHKLSRLDLPVGRLMRLVRPGRSVLLFAALFLGFLSLNPSSASFEPFGTIFGLNGESFNWYLLFVMLVAGFFFRRFWCHVFCPAGAFLDILASWRRRLGRKLAGKPAQTAAKPAQAAPDRRLTKAQFFFIGVYLIGLGVVVWTVWATINAV